MDATYTNSGLATTDIVWNKNNNSLYLTTNEFPNWLIFENLVKNGGPYVSTPAPNPNQQGQVNLFASELDYALYKPNNLIISDPTFGEFGWVGRPNDNLPLNSNWNKSYKPIEILPLDTLSVEAWDWARGKAGPSYHPDKEQAYNGILRFNVTGIAKNVGNIEYENFTYYDGQDLKLDTDVYGAHTQRGGLYHIHAWLPGETLNHSDKVVGYIYDSNNNGNPLFGMGTKIYSPIFDNDNYLIGYNLNEPKQIAVSGYSVRHDYIEARKAQAPLNSSIDNIPQTAPGIFHVDYEYKGTSKEDYLVTTNLLDKFNMGYVDLDGEIVKAYIQTIDYPYTVHTVLSPEYVGAGANDFIISGDKNDTLTGGFGDDTLDGGLADDTAVYTGKLSDYSFTRETDTLQIADQRTTGTTDGTDTLKNIEYLQFSDITVPIEDVQGESQLKMVVGQKEQLTLIRDYDGNLHANTGSVSEDLKSAYKYQGKLDVNKDGTEEAIFTNKVSGRWVTASLDPITGTTDYSKYGQGGTTRIVGIYIDPLVASGDVVQGSDHDSQRRFQNDLKNDNLLVKASGDYDGDGTQEVYWKTVDGTAYLRSLMHADGNIKYANYQSLDQMTNYLTTNGFADTVALIA